MKNRWQWGVGLLGLALCALPAAAVEQVTAKQALNLANQQVPDYAQNQVLSIEGYNTDSALRPRVWDITLYDHKRFNGGLVVRVKDGAVVSKTGAVRLFDDARWTRFGRNFSGYDPAEIVRLARWALDSDQVVAKVVALPRLSDYEVTALTFVLRKPSDGNVPPVWRIKVRARLKTKASSEGWVGYLQYNAESGELIKDELSVK